MYGDSVLLADLVVRDNWTQHGAVSAGSTPRLRIAGSTFLNNTGQYYAHHIYLSTSQLHLVNSVVWNESGGTAAHLASSTLTGTHSLVQGVTLSGTSNLAGTTDPELRFDGRILPESPLRQAGADCPHSRFGMDLERRSIEAPDVGASQWTDEDTDGLPDGWERFLTAGLAILDGTDWDGDGLSDLEEYRTFNTERSCDPFNPDTDGDWLSDGDEILAGTDPLVPDADALATDLNGDGVLDALSTQLGFSLSSVDQDGDGLTNIEELLSGTNPLIADTDGDGYADGVDAFPLDPLVHALDTDPADTAPPVITLVTPRDVMLVED